MFMLLKSVNAVKKTDQEKLIHVPKADEFSRRQWENGIRVVRAIGKRYSRRLW